MTLIYHIRIIFVGLKRLHINLEMYIHQGLIFSLYYFIFLPQLWEEKKRRSPNLLLFSFVVCLKHIHKQTHCTHIYIYRSGYKTATFKTATSQNSDYYKTATTTKHRQLQNSDCYKTAKNDIL